jgi:hypothetical protein
LITALLILVAFIIFFLLFIIFSNLINLSDTKRESVVVDSSEDIVIGGQRDEHGCLGSAGYSWSDYTNACIREWELDEDQKKAAMTAVVDFKPRYSLTVIGVEKIKCPGCFVVELEEIPNRIKIRLNNWEVTGRSLVPEECEQMGGRIVNTVGGSECSSNEKNIGEVTGFISPNICCLKAD